eukprot:CAMPEP_0113874682 /NCGR_PEP_ID=MMETSP0780_2-20120614/4476_1 /TAXON_ID=652834 /ORGANISM="Palpitomonas bilix" /LENGTH=127 /DNA_ID=CAMNT_0000860495 /DNA_START=158 /DNA_END=538 /DNA_ORIENTATION=- /assembly_acc=CAM_ASM_000599
MSSETIQRTQENLNNVLMSYGRDSMNEKEAALVADFEEKKQEQQSIEQGIRRQADQYEEMVAQMLGKGGKKRTEVLSEASKFFGNIFGLRLDQMEASDTVNKSYKAVLAGLGAQVDKIPDISGPLKG